MRITPEVHALARCGTKVSRATDGRAIAGAARECTNALIREGVTNPMAISLTLAMVNVGHRIAESARGAA